MREGGAIASIATVRGGYSMADLDRLAAVAARRHGGATDFADRYEAAWHGVVEALYAEEEPPAERDLLFAAVRAVQRSVDERQRAHGASRRHGYEFGSAPAFAVYWNERVVTQSHEERITERVALMQALSMLAADEYEALAAAAVCDTQQAAADALGLTFWVFRRRLDEARSRVRSLWHEGETPHVGTATTERCGSGHDKAVHGRIGPTGHRYCQECQRLAKQRRRARAAA